MKWGASVARCPPNRAYRRLLSGNSDGLNVIVGTYSVGVYWDGKYNGTELPTGDYWYVVNANDKERQQYVGHFTLYR